MPFDANPFADEPLSDHEILRALYRLMYEQIEPQVRKTNGRVTALERFMWLTSGGLAVVSVMVVPLFIHLIESM